VLRRRPSSARDAGDRDRHALSYDDVGDPAGVPVVYLHGGGDSRLSRHPDDSIAAELGVRLVAVDRCGPAARRPTLRGWAEELLPRLPVDEFAVVGWSAGGPHALALAAVAPERVMRVAAVASLPPPDRLAWVGGDARSALRLSRVSPALARIPLERWGRRPVPATGTPETDDAYTRGRVESFRSGGLWLAYELCYLARPWGFDLRDVRAPVTLWFGERDTTCPPTIAHDLFQRLPNAKLRLVDHTHQLLFTCWREILADVAPEPRTGP
jgi:pimeloyl-ACP methyl ester carboxylesterase